MTTVLFDGDVLVYKVGFASEDRNYLVSDKDGKPLKKFQYKKNAIKYKRKDDVISIEQNANHFSLAFVLMDNILRAVLSQLETEDYKVYLTDGDIKNNFRNDIAKTVPYKGNRKGAVKPLLYQQLRDYLKERHGAEVITGIEADDKLGIEQGEDTIIASIDKDLLMIPGHHYNLTNKTVSYVDDPGTLDIIRTGKTPKLIGGGFKWFCAKMLTGDKVDNIVGIKGYGPVKTHEALEGMFEETMRFMYLKVMLIYINTGNISRFKENCNLLWILRDEDEKFEDFVRDQWGIAYNRKHHDS